MATLDTDILGEHLGTIKGALLALGAPLEAMQSLKWIRDQFEVVQAGVETGPLAQFEQGSKPVLKSKQSDKVDEDGFFVGTRSDAPPITPPEQVQDRPGRKVWTPEMKAAQAERQRARWAARKLAGEAA